MLLVRKKWRGLSPPGKSGNYKNLERERVSYETKEVYKLEDHCFTFGTH